VKTKSLESTKHKRNSSENVSDAELQAATSLAQMSRKKAKKVVKKIVTTEVRQSLLPSTMTSSPNPTRKVFLLA
jgi:ribosomal protein L14E/L6E/L27E